MTSSLDVDALGLTEAVGSEMLPERAGCEADKAPKFVRKLYDMVCNSSLDDHICWTSNGESLQIVRPASFARDVLPLYFKHNNLRSFIRQLNMYGFRRRGKGSRVIEFYHRKFKRGAPHEIASISRNHLTPTEGGGEGEVDPRLVQSLQDMQRSMLVQMEELRQRVAQVEQAFHSRMPPLTSMVERIAQYVGRFEPSVLGTVPGLSPGMPQLYPPYPPDALPHGALGMAPLPMHPAGMGNGQHGPLNDGMGDPRRCMPPSHAMMRPGMVPTGGSAPVLGGGYMRSHAGAASEYGGRHYMVACGHQDGLGSQQVSLEMSMPRLEGGHPGHVAGANGTPPPPASCVGLPTTLDAAAGGDGQNGARC